MKIKTVEHNNRRKAFCIDTRNGIYWYPYVKLDVLPSKDDRIIEVFVDKEIDREGFTYVLESGKEGTVHIDQVLEYNQDPNYLREILLYKLTLLTKKHVEESNLSKRELIRRLNTSASQLYRLLDQSNYKKSINQLVSLLHILECDVDFVVKERSS